MKKVLAFTILIMGAAALTGCDNSLSAMTSDCVRRIKGRLKDPFSFRQIDKSVSFYKDPMQHAEEWSEDYLAEYPGEYKYRIPPHNHYVRIEYTAKNGFGGSVRDRASCMYLGKSLIAIDGRNVLEVNDDSSLSLPR